MSQKLTTIQQTSKRLKLHYATSYAVVLLALTWLTVAAFADAGSRIGTAFGVAPTSAAAASSTGIRVSRGLTRNLASQA